MDQARFVVSSSKGELDVWLFDDGHTSVDFTTPGPGSPSAEYSVRNESDLADCFRVMGLPDKEAQELAQELWQELSEKEREERRRLRGWDESGKDYKMRNQDDFVEIYRGRGSAEVASVIRGVLEAEDIDCLVAGDTGIAFSPVGMPSPGFTVLVRHEDVKQAKQILHSMEDQFNLEDKNLDFGNMRPGIRQSRREAIPFRVIGTIAILIGGAAIMDYTEGGNLWYVLGPVATFAAVVALRSRH